MDLNFDVDEADGDTHNHPDNHRQVRVYCYYYYYLDYYCSSSYCSDCGVDGHITVPNPTSCWVQMWWTVLKIGSSDIRRLHCNRYYYYYNHNPRSVNMMFRIPSLFAIVRTGHFLPSDAAGTAVAVEES